MSSCSMCYLVIYLVVLFINTGHGACHHDQREDVFCAESNQNCTISLDQMNVEWGNCLSIAIVQDCIDAPLCQGIMPCILNLTAFVAQLDA